MTSRSSPPAVPSRVRGGNRGALGFWLFALVFLMFWLVNATAVLIRVWPEGPWIAAQIQREAAIRVTAESQRLLGEALVALQKLPVTDPETSTLTEADERGIRQQIAFVQVLLRSMEEAEVSARGSKKVAKDSRPPAPAAANGKPAENPVSGKMPSSRLADLTGESLSALRELLVAGAEHLAARQRELGGRPDGEHGCWAEFMDVLCRGVDDELVRPLVGEEATRALAEMDKLRRDPPKFLSSADLEYFATLGALGMIGACVQGLASVSVFVGRRRFLPSWTLYYVVRPFVGAGLGVSFYLFLRGGFLNADASIAEVGNPYGYAALAIAAGLFSGEAMEKLRSIASGFFKSNDYGDTQDDTRPRILASELERVDGHGVNLLLAGIMFTPKSVVHVGGKALRTYLLGGERLVVSLDNDELQELLKTFALKKMTVPVFVQNDGKASDVIDLDLAPKLAELKGLSSVTATDYGTLRF